MTSAEFHRPTIGRSVDFDRFEIDIPTISDEEDLIISKSLEMFIQLCSANDNDFDSNAVDHIPIFLRVYGELSNMAQTLVFLPVDAQSLRQTE